jgi:hypothetical protein
MATRKRTTLADLMAAAKVGAIDPETVVVTADEAAADAATIAASQPAASAANGQPTASATEHDCAIPGCKHGDAHPAVSQPDRQVKLECPNCHAVARMTKRALDRTVSGIVCAGDGGVFAIAARRTYGRKSA